MRTPAIFCLKPITVFSSHPIIRNILINVNRDIIKLLIKKPRLALMPLMSG